MTKPLKEILYDHGMIGEAHKSSEAIKAIEKHYISKDEVLEMIGENLSMKPAVHARSNVGAGYTIGVNSFKDELRQAVEERFKNE